MLVWELVLAFPGHRQHWPGHPHSLVTPRWPFSPLAMAERGPVLRAEELLATLHRFILAWVTTPNFCKTSQVSGTVQSVHVPCSFNPHSSARSTRLSALTDRLRKLEHEQWVAHPTLCVRHTAQIPPQAIKLQSTGLSQNVSMGPPEVHRTDTQSCPQLRW